MDGQFHDVEQHCCKLHFVDVVKTEERLMNYWVAAARNYRGCYIERQSAPGVDESSDESSLREAMSSSGAVGLAAR